MLHARAILGKGNGVTFLRKPIMEEDVTQGEVSSVEMRAESRLSKSTPRWAFVNGMVQLNSQDRTMDILPLMFTIKTNKVLAKFES